MSFRILDQAPQYLLADGRVNSGGSLTFYETDLTTLKNTWSDEANTVLNTNPVLMGATGRTVTDVWGDGEYGVVCKDALGVIQWTRNNVRDVATAGATIPPLVAGQFLSNDGSILSWQPVIQVPDMTGESGNILSNDGGNPIWIPPPVAPALDVVIGATSLTLGTSASNDKWFLQKGSASAPPSGTKSTSTSVVFPFQFKTLWWIGVTQTHDGVTAFATLPRQTNSAQSTSGFTVRFSTDENSTASGWNITSPVPFDWVAMGIREVTP